MLHVAAYCGHLEAVQKLLDAGADPTLLSVGKKTPLQVAERTKNSATKKIFKEDLKLKEQLRIAAENEELQTEYIVEHLHGHRKRSGRRRASNRLVDLEFLVHWEGFEDAEDTWEPYEGIKHLDAFKSYAQLALRGWK